MNLIARLLVISKIEAGRKVRTLFAPQGESKAIAANSGGEQRMISPLAREIFREAHGKSHRKMGYLGYSNASEIATEIYR
jgi:hypothetical protein